MAKFNNSTLVGSIESLLKVAAANTEPGGYAGPTTHPVKDVGDQTEAAREGARSAENTSDVKATIPGNPVDSAGTVPDQGSVQMSVGMTSEPTGEKVPSAKGGKEDSDTTHPARTDNSSLEGGKYASYSQQLRALCKQAEEIGSELVATIAVDAVPGNKQAAIAPVSPAAPAAPKAPTQTTDTKSAAQTGYDLAGVFADVDLPTTDKVALDAMVVDAITDIYGLACRRAEKCATFFDSYFKSAEGEEEMPPEEGNPAGGMPPEGGGGDEQAILQMLAGGDTGMGMGMGGGGGGAPPDAGMGGGAPPDAGMGGGMPPEAGAGAGGGDAQEIAMLEQILQELDANPAQVEKAAQAELVRRSQKSNQKLAASPKYAAMKRIIQELVSRSA